MKIVLTVIGIVLLLDAILCSYGLFRLPIRPKPRAIVNWVVIPLEMFFAFLLFNYETMLSIPALIFCLLSCYAYALFVFFMTADRRQQKRIPSFYETYEDEYDEEL